MSITFGDAAPWEIVGLGETRRGIGLIIVRIEADKEKEVLEWFAASKAMTVTFHKGNEKPWSMKTSGNREASVALSKCTADLNKAITQPFSTDGGPKKHTQPFGAEEETDQ